MRGDGGRLRPGAQDGYTVVEMIITMALTTIVSGAIFSSFLLLDRIQTAWEQRDQARAVGVLAEQSLLRDVQTYKVSLAAPNSLVLEGVSIPPSTPFKVSYYVQSLPGGGSVLKRSVSNPPSFATTVAHGVQSIDAVCNKTTNILTVTMILDAISTRSKQEHVVVNPVLTLTPRNGKCP